MSFTQIPLAVPGRLYRSAMPRSGLDHDGGLLAAYERALVTGVVVCVPWQQAEELTGTDLRALYRKRRYNLIHVPAQDYGVPDDSTLDRGVREALERLRHGETLAVHCAAGLGRTGLFVGCVVGQVARLGAADAIDFVRCYVPGAVETAEQELAVARHLERVGMGGVQRGR